MNMTFEKMMTLTLLVVFLWGISISSMAQPPRTVDVTFLPVDEGAAVPDFSEFRKLLLKAVEDGNDKFILDHTYEDISFGYKIDEEVEEEQESSGKEEFGDILKSPEREEVYRIIKDNVRFGGTWGDRRWNEYGKGYGKEYFCANYVHMCWPEDRVPLNRDYVAVTGDKVNVRSGPGASYNVIATLSYEIVEVVGEHPRDLEDDPSKWDNVGGQAYPWYPVRLQSGIKGYIFGQFVSIPSMGTPILVFKKIEGVWKIVYIHLSC